MTYCDHWWVQKTTIEGLITVCRQCGTVKAAIKPVAQPKERES
jgi:hypothetical protein